MLDLMLPFNEIWQSASLVSKVTILETMTGIFVGSAVITRVSNDKTGR